MSSCIVSWIVFWIFLFAVRFLFFYWIFAVRTSSGHIAGSHAFDSLGCETPGRLVPIHLGDPSSTRSSDESIAAFIRYTRPIRNGQITRQYLLFYPEAYFWNPDMIVLDLRWDLLCVRLTQWTIRPFKITVYYNITIYYYTPYNLYKL